MFAQTVPTGVQRIFADENPSITIDGYDDHRIDVDVAVIDTGIDLDHPDLDVVGGADCTNESGGPPWSRSGHLRRGWRRLDGHNQLPKLIAGVKFVDGIEAVRQQHQAAA